MAEFHALREEELKTRERFNSYDLARAALVL